MCRKTSPIKVRGRQLDERFVEMQWLYQEEKAEEIIPAHRACTELLRAAVTSHSSVNLQCNFLTSILEKSMSKV